MIFLLRARFASMMDYFILFNFLLIIGLLIWLWIEDNILKRRIIENLFNWNNLANGSDKNGR